MLFLVVIRLLRHLFWNHNTTRFARIFVPFIFSHSYSIILAFFFFVFPFFFSFQTCPLGFSGDRRAHDIHFGVFQSTGLWPRFHGFIWFSLFCCLDRLSVCFDWILMLFLVQSRWRRMMFWIKAVKIQRNQRFQRFNRSKVNLVLVFAECQRCEYWSCDCNFRMCPCMCVCSFSRPYGQWCWNKLFQFSRLTIPRNSPVVRYCPYCIRFVFSFVCVTSFRLFWPPGQHTTNAMPHCVIRFRCLG